MSGRNYLESHNTKYDKAFYYVSDSSDASESPCLPSTCPSDNSKFTAIESRIEAVDSVYLLCIAVHRLSDYFRNEFHNENSSVLFGSCIRKACMYYCFDVCIPIVNFISEYYKTDMNEEKPIDQVVVKFLEKVVKSMEDNPTGINNNILCETIKLITYRKVGIGLTLKEFLRSDAISRKQSTVIIE